MEDSSLHAEMLTSLSLHQFANTQLPNKKIKSLSKTELKDNIGEVQDILKFKHTEGLQK